MCSANCRVAKMLAVMGLCAASFGSIAGCEKLGCGKKPQNQTAQALEQQDTTFPEIPGVQEPDLSSQPQQKKPALPQVVEDVQGKYTVQVSSWRTRRKAEEDAQRYRAQGFNAYIQEAYIPEKDGTWYRVRVGRFTTKADAEQMAAQLAGLLESGFWVDRMRQ
ncbi:MAG: SPOR domain-containing protein [candidate division KSB1 bacterium]|nr:SPOR domain-containing protein [candidate division KSB1 bacterium]